MQGHLPGPECPAHEIRPGLTMIARLKGAHFREGFLADSPTLSERGLSAYWVSPGQIQIGETEFDLDILKHSQTHGSGMFDALFYPLVDLVCPSNQLSGVNGFPAGGSRHFGPTARPGHEVVGLLMGATAGAVEKLRNKGVHGPCYGVVNINIGCGQCESCRAGGSPDVCYEGQTYLGLGDRNSGHKEKSWLYRETGRYEIAGFLTQLAVPIPSKQFFPLPCQDPGSLAELAIYGLADAVACTKNVVDSMGMGFDFPRYYQSDQPAVLVIGAGRLGTLCCLVVHDLFPAARIHALDLSSNRITVLKAACPEVSTHFLEDREEIVERVRSIAGENLKGKFHYIIHCASHQAVNAYALNRLAETCLHRRGRIGRLDHTSVSGLEAGGQTLVDCQLGHISALGPADNFPYALELISRHKGKLMDRMHLISGELSDNVEQIKTVTETSAANLKEEGRYLAVGIQLNRWGSGCET